MSPTIIMRLARAAPDRRPLSARLRPAGAVLSKAMGWPVRYWRARQHLAQLAGMTDVQLKDIGLTRADVISATALPRDEDPTERLALVVQERRITRGWRRP
ncbi:hypothetical protein SLNSH_22625 [Alsobacter soli]|uniref:YjiS-like domain-containing protein n=1 Tax=Alsobacter soli TaxID=2109933 RepID=A0A2T1HM53_9HYPH|nr:DUF1127 domain-containing protein [Alsobacter soli]PSC02722.1 hypothetical protein SLNSH_22625 [Alsobacter soli]